MTLQDAVGGGGAMIDGLFPQDQADVSFIGRDPDHPPLSTIIELWECHRCWALVRDRGGHVVWHSGVDSTTPAVRTPSEGH